MYLSISGDRKIYYVTIYGTGSIQIPQCMARHPGRPQATVVKNEKLYESYHRIYCDGVKLYFLESWIPLFVRTLLWENRGSDNGILLPSRIVSPNERAKLSFILRLNVKVHASNNKRNFVSISESVENLQQ